MLVAHGRGLGDPGEGGPRGDAPSRCTRGHAGGRSPRRRRGGELLAPARGARLPDAVPRPRRDARMPASRARGPPRLLAGPLRRMEVRGLQPGPQLHAGCGARRPPARRWRRQRADAQPPGPCERGRVRRDGTPMISQAPAQVPDAITPRRERPRAWAALLAIVLFAAVLRCIFFIGFGVTGDDIIYAGMSRELLRNGWKAVDLQWGVNYRLGLSVPVALLFRVGGFNDLTFACIRDRRVFVRDVAFYGVVGTAVAATFAADYWATGDVLNRLQVQLPQSGSAVGPLRELLLQYPRWVWRRSPDGTMPFGY